MRSSAGALNIAADIDRLGLISSVDERLQDRVPARKRNVTLRRKPSHEYADFFVRHKSHAFKSSFSDDLDLRLQPHPVHLEHLSPDEFHERQHISAVAFPVSR